MITLLLVISVVLIITFKKEIVSFLNKPASTIKKMLKEIVSFFNKPASTTKKTLIGYVVTPVKVTALKTEGDGICKKTITFCDDRTIIITYNSYREISLWENIKEGDICSQIQKFCFGYLVSEKFLPVTPEHVCFSRKGPYCTIN